MSRRTLAPLLIALLSFSAACGGDDPTPTQVEENTPPNVSITSPVTGTLVVDTEPVTFVASATDPDPGDPGPVSWTSDIDGALGTGNEVTTTLSVGSHTVKARVADSDGAADSSSVAIEVVPTPGTVTDLSVVSRTDSSVALSWTEVDDGTGAPADYEVRFSTTSLDPAASTVAQEGSCAPSVAGSTVGSEITCEVHGLEVATAYLFGVVATRDVEGTRVSGASSDAASAQTHFLEDFARFTVGDAPSAPHDRLTYTQNDGQSNLTVQVVDAAGDLTDQPLLMSKPESGPVGAPNFVFNRSGGTPLVDATSGVIRLMADVVVTSESFCQFLSVRSSDFDISVWVDLHDLPFTQGQSFAMSIEMDVDAGTVSATQDGQSVEMNGRLDDSGDVVTGQVLDFPYLPWRFGFAGCTTNAQELAVDNIRIELSDQ